MTVTTPITTPFTAETTAAEIVEGVDLCGRRVIVTGGASGIGVGTARALSSAGAEVTYGPLSSGWLSGRADPTKTHRAAMPAAARSFDVTVPANQAKAEAVRQFTQLATEAGMPLNPADNHLAASPAVENRRLRRRWT
jgi:NAD(P)-dependent dehydrogenase (short-subunit alcohol dehydrogenase family)